MSDLGEKPKEQSQLIRFRPRKQRTTLIRHDSTVLIPYRPYAAIEKWLKYRFSAWSSTKAWFVVGLIVMFFAFGGPGYIINWLLQSVVHGSGVTAATAAATTQLVAYFLLLLGSLAAATSIAVLSKPTHLLLDRDGIRFCRIRFFGESEGKLYAWRDLLRVSLHKPKGKTSPQDYYLRFISHKDRPLDLRMGHIASLDERATLLEAINTWAAGVPRDAEIPELLSPPQEHSYTELWLQALSAPPKRERLTPLAEGARLKEGRYRILSQLGVGGQGTAYLALLNDGSEPNTRAGTVIIDQQRAPALANSWHEVVLKESILPVYVDVAIRKQALESFQREAQMLQSLDHAQVVKLIDFFVEDHRSYLVLEHIEGKSLRELVHNQGRFSEGRVRDLALQMCDILEYLHGITPPVVHRDFTPDNLILHKTGTLKLVDFNVAHQSESTTTGTVVGKHAYIPPEQFRGKPTIQSDVYAMGATMHFLLTGEDPEPISKSHPRHLHPDISPELDAIVARATDIDEQRRYADVDQARADLLALAGKAPTT